MLAPAYLVVLSSLLIAEGGCSSASSANRSRDGSAPPADGGATGSGGESASGGRGGSGGVTSGGGGTGAVGSGGIGSGGIGTGGTGSGGIGTGGVGGRGSGGVGSGGLGTAGTGTGGRATGGTGPAATGGTGTGGIATGGVGGRGTGGAGTGDSGALDAGSTIDGGGGVMCGGEACAFGQICIEDTVVPNYGTTYYTTACRDNPCGSTPVSCSCAKDLCVGPGISSCTGASNSTLLCQSVSVCASPETRIATPSGERRIADLVPGDLVYSEDRGALRAVPVLRVSQTLVYQHHVVQVTMADGAVIEMSEGHPTADGRTFGQLRAGDLLDGAPILSSRIIPYRFSRTYDILPASETGTYVASGRLVGSTLR